MIDLHYWPTPNGHKITLFLEEAGLEYTIHPVDIGAGDQFKPEYLEISPNNKMPAIVDRAPADGGAPISVFESGAILLYLANKTGKFFADDLRGRVEVNQWLHWQMGGLGPMTGQYGHFHVYAPEDHSVRQGPLQARSAAPARRARQAPGRTASSSPAHVTASPTWPRTRGSIPTPRRRSTSTPFANLRRWHAPVAARPAVQRAYALGRAATRKREMTAGNAQDPLRNHSARTA